MRHAPRLALTLRPVMTFGHSGVTAPEELNCSYGYAWTGAALSHVWVRGKGWGLTLEYIVLEALAPDGVSGTGSVRRRIPASEAARAE
jgi:hypothetical protein